MRTAPGLRLPAVVLLGVVIVAVVGLHAASTHSVADAGTAAAAVPTPPAQHRATSTPAPTDTPSPTPPPPTPSPTAAPTPDAAAPLRSDIESLIAASGRRVGVRLVDLGGSNPADVSLDSSDSFTAGSTYKLVALADEAQRIATGRTTPRHTVCYQDADQEDGWFDDYADGNCYTLQTLAQRAGIYSDNTAGHMLVRDLGGADALNAFAAAAGVVDPAFYDPNTTTADGLAAVWLAEATGRLGGAAAQKWLYPMLTGTVEETGIPAGVPAGTTVVHKTGWYDTVEDDAALVNGPHGQYVLVICTDGDASDAGWSLLAQISQRVWQYEQTRS